MKKSLQGEERLQQLVKLEYLGLSPELLDKEFDNPLEIKTKDEIDNPLRHFLRIACKPENFGFTCKHIFNIKLAPFQLVILNELWHRKYPMLIASRGASKSFLLALYAMLRALINQGSKVVIVGAAFRQSKVVFEYCEHIWHNAPILRDMVGIGGRSGPRREIDRCACILGDSSIVAIPLGDGCLSPYAQITYGDHFGTISERHVVDNHARNIIYNINSIWSNGKFVDSDEMYCNGLAKTKIITCQTGHSIEGTLNHKIKVLTSNGIIWKELQNINIGDYILVDRSIRWHNGQENITESEAYALGLMIGDGCWTQKYNLLYSTQDKELIKAIREGTNYTFNGKCDNYHYRHSGKKDRTDWLRKWGYSNDACYTIDKYLPDNILRCSRTVMSACISGLYDTDGHVQVSTAKGGTTITVGFTNTSERLVDQLQYILLHYGIVATKLSRKRKENDNWNIVHELLITGQNVKKFAEQINFRLSRKRLILEAAIATKKRWITNGDEVPFIKEKMLDIARNYRTKKGEGNRISASKIEKLKIITRETINKFIRAYSFTNNPFLANLIELANVNIYYDKVSNIDNSECVTYDMHVPNTHEYCANGFFSHNSKIRGQRANVIIADEFSSIPKSIYEEVVSGFIAVQSDPIDAMERAARVRVLKRIGKWTPELAEHESTKAGFGNQAIISGTANYTFNYFADYWKEYKGIIQSNGDVKKLLEIFNGKIRPKFNWRNYSIIRLPVTLLPENFMDEEHVARAQVTADSGTYAVEYGAVFAGDSNGFFRRSLIESCVVSQNNIHNMLPGVEIFSPVLRGQPHNSYARYIFGVDTASEKDNFAIVVIEVHKNHRRVVYCWTTTRAKHLERIRHGVVSEKNFYAYCARKIRDLMEVFNCDHISMDSQGGGRAVLEALHDSDKLKHGEHLIWEVRSDDINKPNENDDKVGLHIVEMIHFAKAAWVSEANHGLKKDMEDKVLLFPYFDPIKLYEANQEDMNAGRIIISKTGEEIQLQDTFEDAVMEIEALKDELVTIVHTQTPNTNRDRWDTPEVKQAGGKKGRLRKDRYSALLMANMAARQMLHAYVPPQYHATGGFAKDFVTTGKDIKDLPMYQAPDWFLNPESQDETPYQFYGTAVKRTK